MIGTKSGKLKAKFLPAIYFDSSVLIDYWMTEGLETESSERGLTTRYHGYIIGDKSDEGSGYLIVS